MQSLSSLKAHFGRWMLEADPQALTPEGVKGHPTAAILDVLDHLFQKRSLDDYDLDGLQAHAAAFMTLNERIPGGYYAWHAAHASGAAVIALQRLETLQAFTATNEHWRTTDPRCIANPAKEAKGGKL